MNKTKIFICAGLLGLPLVLFIIMFTNPAILGVNIENCEQGDSHYDKIIFEVEDNNIHPAIPTDYLHSKLDIIVNEGLKLSNANELARDSLVKRFGLNETQARNLEIIVTDIKYDVVGCTKEKFGAWEILNHPLVLFFTGGGIVGILIDLYLKSREESQTRIDEKRITLRLEMQRLADVNRENYRFGLERKVQVTLELSEMSSDFFVATQKLLLNEFRNEDSKGKIYNDAINTLMRRFHIISNYLTVYFENKSTLLVEFAELFEIMRGGLTLCSIPKDDKLWEKEKRTLIEQMMKKRKDTYKDKLYDAPLVELVVIVPKLISEFISKVNNSNIVQTDKK